MKTWTIQPCSVRIKPADQSAHGVRVPCIAGQIRARSSLHLTDESALADPDPGPRLRHRGYEHWLTHRF